MTGFVNLKSRPRPASPPTFVALERLEELNKGVSGELLVVLGGDLDAHLQVLSDVGRQHGLQAFNGVLDRQLAKVVHQPLEAGKDLYIKYFELLKN